MGEERVMGVKRKRRRNYKKERRQLLIIWVLIILAVILLGVSGYALFQAFQKPSAEELLEKGFQQMQEEDYEGAKDSFQTVIEMEQIGVEGDSSRTDSQDTAYIAEAYRGLGLVSFELEQYEEVQMHLQKVIELKGEETPILYNLLGISAMKLESYDSALEAFERGIEFPETETYQDAEGKEQTVDYAAVLQEMKFNRIVCLEKRLDWEKAKEAIETYINEYPNDETAQKEAEFLSTR